MLIGLAITVGLVAAAGGTMQALAKTVVVSVDGPRQQITTYANSVESALASAGVTVGAHDTLASARTATIGGRSAITVQSGQLFTVTVDGRVRKLWTTAKSVDQAMAELGLGVEKCALSANRGRPIPLTGLAGCWPSMASPLVLTGATAGCSSASRPGPLTAGWPTPRGPIWPASRSRSRWPSARSPNRASVPGPADTGAEQR